MAKRDHEHAKSGFETTARRDREVGDGGIRGLDIALEHSEARLQQTKEELENRNAELVRQGTEAGAAHEPTLDDDSDDHTGKTVAARRAEPGALEQELALEKARGAVALAEKSAALERARRELVDLSEQNRATHQRISELEQELAALARSRARARSQQGDVASLQRELETDVLSVQRERAQLAKERRSLEHLAQSVDQARASVEERSAALRQQAVSVAEQQEALDAAHRMLEETTVAASESLGAEEAEVLRGQEWVEQERRSLERVRVELDKRADELEEATRLLIEATREHQRRSGGTGPIDELAQASAHLAGGRGGPLARMGGLWDSHPWVVIVAAVALTALLTATVMSAGKTAPKEPAAPVEAVAPSKPVEMSADETVP